MSVATTVSPLFSAQYAQIVAEPMVKQSSADWGSKLRSSYAKWSSNAATAAYGSAVAIVRLPGGKIRINKALSQWSEDAVSATTVTAQLGFGAYLTDDAEATPNEQTVAANGTAIATIDLFAGSSGNFGPGYVVVDSVNGVDVTMTIAGASGVSTTKVIEFALSFQQGN